MNASNNIIADDPMISDMVAEDIAVVAEVVAEPVAAKTSKKSSKKTVVDPAIEEAIYPEYFMSTSPIPIPIPISPIEKVVSVSTAAKNFRKFKIKNRSPQQIMLSNGDLLPPRGILIVKVKTEQMLNLVKRGLILITEE